MTTLRCYLPASAQCMCDSLSLKRRGQTADSRGMAADRDDEGESTYTLELSPPDRPRAAAHISITVDDGADIVIRMSGRDSASMVAYLTVDDAEELLGALAEVIRLPSDRTGTIKSTTSL